MMMCVCLFFANRNTTDNEYEQSKIMCRLISFDIGSFVGHVREREEENKI